MKNIYLVGFMGTGKTSAGKLLAEKLGKKFIEMDAVIEETEGKKITDIFASGGENCFRKSEKENLGKISRLTDLVVSCGGGLVCDEDNLETLLNSGIVFCLTADAATIYERTKKHTHRPLLNVAHPRQEIKNLLKKRQDYYNKAHYIIKTDDIAPEEVADKIIVILKNLELHG